MTPLSRKYKKEYALELLTIAEGDLESARGLAQIRRGRQENIIYTAQQSIEKSLKAVLVFYERPIVHTHDLDVLVTALSEYGTPPEAHRLGAFSQYATVRRYEQGYEELNPNRYTTFTFICAYLTESIGFFKSGKTLTVVKTSSNSK